MPITQTDALWKKLLATVLIIVLCWLPACFAAYSEAWRAWRNLRLADRLRREYGDWAKSLANVWRGP
jgi:hypothetical protein